MSKIFSYVWLLMMLMICFSLNSRSGRLLRHVPRQKPLSAHALRCKDTQKVDNQGRVVNFFEQKSAFSSGRRILLSSTAFRANPLHDNLQCSQKNRQRQMPQKEIRDFSAIDSAYLWQRYALSPAKKRYISKCCVDDIINGQYGFRFIRSIRALIISPNTNCTNLSNLFGDNNSKRR